MNKQEMIDYYEADAKNPKYGDRVTSETIEKCYDQVKQKIDEGVQDWDGCMNKALCCRFFEHTFDMMKLSDDFTKAHFEGDQGKYPVTLRVQHKCNQLQEDNSCKKYEGRPQICKDYLCQASKVRRNMFLRMKYPEIAKKHDEANKEKDK
jgi:hypothetical protein